MENYIPRENQCFDPKNVMGEGNIVKQKDREDNRGKKGEEGGEKDREYNKKRKVQGKKEKFGKETKSWLVRNSERKKGTKRVGR